MMGAAVFDASATTKWFVRDPLTEKAVYLRQLHAAHAPTLILYELMSALWKYVPLGQMSIDGMVEAQAMLAQNTELYLDGPYLENAARLAVNLPHSPYDMSYVALAMDLNMPLITADKKLVRKLQAAALSLDIIDLHSAEIGS